MIFKAISDKTRREIITLLFQNDGMNVKRLSKNFNNISRAAISKQLIFLLRSGLVTAKKIGRKRIYRLNPEPMREVVEWLKQFFLT